jgi:hypothetical protein
MWWEKQGNTWWVKCHCTKSFPASDRIIQHPTVKLRCPFCTAEFLAKDAAELFDPLQIQQ